MTRRLLLVVLALALVGCGVPQDGQPRALDPSTAPFRFFERDVAPPPVGELQAELWFLQGERLVPVQRPLEQPGAPRQVLEQLLDGPTEAELAAGISSAIPETLELVDFTVAEGTAVVTFGSVDERTQVPAFAQIVASLDGRPDVSGVRFRTPDGDVPVPNEEGVLTSGALTRGDYGVLLGREAPPLPPAPAPAADAPAS